MKPGFIYLIYTTSKSVPFLIRIFRCRVKDIVILEPVPFLSKKEMDWHKASFVKDFVEVMEYKPESTLQDWRHALEKISEAWTDSPR